MGWYSSRFCLVDGESKVESGAAKVSRHVQRARAPADRATGSRGSRVFILRHRDCAARLTWYRAPNESCGLTCARVALQYA